MCTESDEVRQRKLTKQLFPLIRQTYLLCATSPLVLIDGETHTNRAATHTNAECLWSVKMSASLGEAHMHFREVPLIRHEIQFKTWSASRSPALMQRQIPTEDGEQRPLRRARVGVSAVANTQVPQVSKHMKYMSSCGRSVVCFLFWPYSASKRPGNIAQLFVFISTLLPL